MDVVMAGTALYVSPSNTVQLSPSSLSIGSVLITRPDIPIPAGASAPDLSISQGPSSSSQSQSQAPASKSQGVQHVHTTVQREASPQVFVDTEVVKNVGLARRIDVYL